MVCRPLFPRDPSRTTGPERRADGVRAIWRERPIERNDKTRLATLTGPRRKRSFSARSARFPNSPGGAPRPATLSPAVRLGRYPGLARSTGFRPPNGSRRSRRSPRSTPPAVATEGRARKQHPDARGCDVTRNLNQPMPPTGELAEASPEMRRVRDQAVDSSDGAAGSCEVRARIARRTNPSSPARARVSPPRAGGDRRDPPTVRSTPHRPRRSPVSPSPPFPAFAPVRSRRRIAPPHPSAAASTA